MTTIKIFRNNKAVEPDIMMTINNVDEYYCTEKMFYVRQTSGSALYISLDTIDTISVFSDEEEENGND